MYTYCKIDLILCVSWNDSACCLHINLEQRNVCLIITIHLWNERKKVLSCFLGFCNSFRTEVTTEMLYITYVYMRSLQHLTGQMDRQGCLLNEYASYTHKHPFICRLNGCNILCLTCLGWERERGNRAGKWKWRHQYVHDIKTLYFSALYFWEHMYVHMHMFNYTLLHVCRPC